MKKYRGVLIGITVVTIVTIIFGAALMGSIVGAKPNAVPIAFVMEDEGAVLPNGMEINIGEMISEKLLFNDLLPFEWVQIDSLQELQQKLDDREIYGAIILPQALSQHVFSLMSEQQQVAEIKAVYNEGANMQA